MSESRSRTIATATLQNNNLEEGPGYTVGLSQALESNTDDEQQNMFKTGITREMENDRELERSSQEK